MAIELPKEPTDEDLAALNRWFAVQLNNRVWDELDAGTTNQDSPEDDRVALMYAATAAAHHWYQVGNPANQARAEYLVSRAAAATGFVDQSLRHGQRSLDLCVANSDVVTDWDLAMAHEALARAQAAGGMTAEAQATLAEAKRLASDVADPQDRAVVEGELAKGPWFGLPT